MMPAHHVSWMTPGSECHGRASFQLLRLKGLLCCWGKHVVVGGVQQIGDCAGAGYLLQMTLQKTKKMLGVIDASVRLQCCSPHCLCKCA